MIALARHTPTPSPCIGRIVRRDELLADVMLEAISQGLYVWTDFKRTVIARERPRGMQKVHATYRLPTDGDAA